MFVSAFFLDILWALYIRRVAQRKKVSAATLSTLIGTLSTVWIFGIQKDILNSVFWLAGLFSGTYVGLLIEERRELKQKASEPHAVVD